MAYLTEDQVWEEGIYQWETDDPVVGGPAGLDNLPTKQLANRTRYLKARADAHDAAPDPHPQYLTQAEGAAAFDQISAATNAINSHTGAADPHPAYFNLPRGDARFARIDHAHAGLYEPAGNVAAHANASDPHPQYLSQQRGDARYAKIGADGGMANHLAAADPHPQYMQNSETDALYSKLGHNHTGVYEPAGAMTAHTNAADPHTQYQTQARSDARYSQLGHGHPGVYDPAGSGQAARDWAYNWVSGAFSPVGHGHAAEISTAIASAFSSRSLGSSTSGYQILPGGLIFQWGRCTALTPFSFPVAFPNALRSLVGMLAGSSGTNHGLVARDADRSLSGATFLSWNTVDGGAGHPVNWFAVGY